MASICLTACPAKKLPSPWSWDPDCWVVPIVLESEALVWDDDELGEIAATDKWILLFLAMDGYAVNGLFLLPLFYFFHFLIYLGYGHVVGLGSLTSFFISAR